MSKKPTRMLQAYLQEDGCIAAGLTNTINVINGIAFQNKILALNAAVAAASPLEDQVRELEQMVAVFNVGNGAPHTLTPVATRPVVASPDPVLTAAPAPKKIRRRGRAGRMGRFLSVSSASPLSRFAGVFLFLHAS